MREHILSEISETEKKKQKHTEWYHLYVESSKIKKKENSQKHKVDNWLRGA